MKHQFEQTLVTTRDHVFAILAAARGTKGGDADGKERSHVVAGGGGCAAAAAGAESSGEDDDEDDDDPGALFQYTPSLRAALPTTLFEGSSAPKARKAKKEKKRRGEEG